MKYRVTNLYMFLTLGKNWRARFVLFIKGMIVERWERAKIKTRKMLVEGLGKYRTVVKLMQKCSTRFLFQN